MTPHGAIYNRVSVRSDAGKTTERLKMQSLGCFAYDSEVSAKIEDNWILRFIDSYDVEIQDWVDHALKGETGGSSAWDGYVASITADALVKSQTSGVPEKVVTGGTPNFYKK